MKRLSALVILAGVTLRIHNASVTGSGELLCDERYIGRAYVWAIQSGETVLSGATQLLYGTALSLWYSGFGPSAASGRSFATLLGVLGVLAFGRAAGQLLGREAGWYAAALAALSFHPSYFGSTMFECGTVILAASLQLLLFRWWYDGPGPTRSIVCGGWGALLLLTYPGLLIGLAATGAGLMLAYQLRVLDFVRYRAVPLIAVGVSSAGVLAFAAWIHTVLSSSGKFLFSGGGSAGGNAAPYSEVLVFYLADFFRGGLSGYLAPNPIPFLEYSIIALASAGAIRAFKGPEPSFERALVFAVPVMFLLLPLTGPAAGIRRGIFLAVPMLLLASSALGAWGHRWRVAGIVALSVFAVESFSYRLLAEPVHSMLGFCTPGIADESLRSELRNSRVALLDEEFFHPSDFEMHRAYSRLLGYEDRRLVRFSAVDDRELPAITLLAWDPSLVREVEYPESCVRRIDVIAGGPDAERIARVRFENSLGKECPSIEKILPGWSRPNRPFSRAPLNMFCTPPQSDATPAPRMHE